MPDEHEVLSAMLDGEAVDIEELEWALADPRGRRALLDFVQLRQAARTEQAVPRGDFSARFERLCRKPRSVLRRRVPLPPRCCSPGLSDRLWALSPIAGTPHRPRRRR